MTIRRLEASDSPRVIELCAEHAAYERSAYEPNEKVERLRAAVRDSILLGWVAVRDEEIVAYATATIDFSTWNAAAFMHLDCLFVRDAHRGGGLGRRLLEAVIHEARSRGIDELQWQTPRWNVAADRFYRRIGAVAREKLRYHLNVHEVSPAMQVSTSSR